MSEPGMARERWANWAGNQACEPRQIAHPGSEEEVSELVASASRRGLEVRVAGAGHSFTPICLSDGLLLSLDQMRGIVKADPVTRRVVARAGTPIADFGDRLWDAGLCLRNQGDIDSQHIAGAISTATHGSGIGQQCFSATARRIRVILPSGEARDIGEESPDLLAAAQVSIGMLGIIVSVELDVREAFLLAEAIEYWSYAELLERWDEEFLARHHFSFFWMPAAESPGLVFLDCPDGVDMSDRAYVKLYDALPLSAADPGSGPTSAAGKRVDRPYRIYPQYCAPNFYEMEYMVPFHCGKQAFQAVREVILKRHPESIFSVEVRSTAADSAYLSPNFGRNSIVISVSGLPDRDYLPFLQNAASVMDSFGARPHWGKLHFFTSERLAEVLPEYNKFCAIRRQLDPSGVFLNDSLRCLFE